MKNEAETLSHAERGRAKDLFLNQIRFDLMFKYLYLKNQEKYGEFTDFFKDLYFEQIRIFNNFYERSPQKFLPKDFIDNFDTLAEKMRNEGFNRDYPIPITKENQIENGAHRLVCSFLYDLDIYTERAKKYVEPKKYNYEYFQKRHINSLYADYAALEYVKLNPNAYIVNLQPITSPEYDSQVINILEKYGFVYYKKNIFLSYNGLVNLKKVFYGTEKWIGTQLNDFRGARKHAKSSSGPYPLRAFIFVCDDSKNVRKAKEEIRNIYNIGNSSVHINDTHEEAIEIAQYYFNDNSLFLLNNRPYNFEDKIYDNLIDKLKQHLDSEKVCCAGSSALNLFGLRRSEDLDYLSLNFQEINNEFISEHSGKWESFYPKNKYELILNPENYFYYRGVKFLTLENILKMKSARGEEKDIKDCEMIQEFLDNAVDYSAIQNTNFEIYSDILQKLTSSVRAEVLFKQSFKQKYNRIMIPLSRNMLILKYKFLSKLSNKKKDYYLKKLNSLLQ